MKNLSEHEVYKNLLFCVCPELYLSHYSDNIEGDHGPCQSPNFSRFDARGTR